MDNRAILPLVLPRGQRADMMKKIYPELRSPAILQEGGFNSSLKPIKKDTIIRSTLILGIGNILRKDDGVGIHIINRLRGKDLSPGVRLLDGGTAGLDLITYLEDLDRLIIVDAFLAEGCPGDINVISSDELNSGRQAFSGHSSDIFNLVDLTAALWKRPETIIVGIIPKDCESYEIGLSKEVENAFDKAVQIILGLTGD